MTFVTPHDFDQGRGVDAGGQARRKVVGGHHLVVLCHPVVTNASSWRASLAAKTSPIATASPWRRSYPSTVSRA